MPARGVLPVVVGIVRGALLAGALTVVGLLIVAFAGGDLDGAELWAPIVVAALRVAEAWLLDQQRGQPRQEGPLGGGPA